MRKSQVWMDHYLEQATDSRAWKMQGLFVPVARIGSGDPLRVLRLYTTNKLDILWSIYCWDICTTCDYQNYVLLYWLIRSYSCWSLSVTTWLTDWLWLSLALYCAMPYIAACVDVSRTVFWDHSKRVNRHTKTEDRKTNGTWKMKIRTSVATQVTMPLFLRLVQGLFVPFACQGSGDPVRVLRLLHNEYTGYNWSIYCWDICTTCRYRSYVLLY